MRPGTPGCRLTSLSPAGTDSPWMMRRRVCWITWSTRGTPMCSVVASAGLADWPAAAHGSEVLLDLLRQAKQLLIAVLDLLGRLLLTPPRRINALPCDVAHTAGVVTKHGTGIVDPPTRSGWAGGWCGTARTPSASSVLSCFLQRLAVRHLITITSSNSSGPPPSSQVSGTYCPSTRSKCTRVDRPDARNWCTIDSDAENCCHCCSKLRTSSTGSIGDTSTARSRSLSAVAPPRPQKFTSNTASTPGRERKMQQWPPPFADAARLERYSIDSYSWMLHTQVSILMVHGKLPP